MTLYIATAICAGWLLQGDVTPGLYSPLLAEHFHGISAAEMVVTDMAVPMPTVRGSAGDWLKNFDDVPFELRRAASQPSPAGAGRLDASMFPAGTRLVSAKYVEEIFAGSGIEENWSAFRHRFESKGWLAFSAGLLTDDQLNALVYYEGRCGGLCGEGGYVWLRRETANSPWRIAKKIVAWIS